MKLIRRIIISFGVTLTAVCFGALVLFNWSVTGWKALTVPTGSMRPSIPPGSLVLMKDVPNSSLKVGDVITYTNPQDMKTTITHRITKAYKIDGRVPAFITQGDANPTADRPVVGGLVKGKVVWHAPYLGKALEWSRTWAGVAVMVYLPALLIMLDELRRLSRHYKLLRPYKSALILARERANAPRRPGRAATTVLASLILAGSAVFAFPVHALLRSNTVALANNTLRAAPRPPATCTTGSGTNSSTTTTTVNASGSGMTNLHVSTSTSQTAQTGNATNSSTTNGGSATSGNASNCSSTTTAVNVH
jgi:signal peptidase